MKSRPQTHPDTPIWPLVGLVVIAIVIAALQAGPALGGDLRGNDDMMRMQQVRDLLSGDKSWFDVSQARLLTPEGGAMHWSRLPDLFMAAVILISQPIIGPSAAEALAAGLWPLLLLASVLALLSMVLSRLGVNLAGQLSAFFFFAGSAAIYNFWPGRIGQRHDRLTCFLHSCCKRFGSSILCVGPCAQKLSRNSTCGIQAAFAVLILSSF